MTNPTYIHNFATYTIHSKSGNTQATFIPERGGMMSSLIMTGHDGRRELLFQDKSFWNAPKNQLIGAWPFCFPICGRLQRLHQVGYYYYDGQLYQLPIHGFAWQEAWQLEEIDKDYIVLTLEDNAYTRTLYPFKFEVVLQYQLSDTQLLCKQSYINRSEYSMPYYAGFHPYFLTPPPGQGKEQIMLHFSARRRFQYNQQLTDFLGTQEPLPMPTNITNPNINEQLSELGADKTISLQYANGDTLALCVTGIEDPELFPLVQLYTPADQAFICIEPWMSFPNALNSVTGVRWLKPGETEQGLLTLSFNLKKAVDTYCEGLLH